MYYKEMDKRYIYKYLISLVVVFSFFVGANYVLAIDPLLQATGKPGDVTSECLAAGDCKISDFLNVGIRVTEIIIGLSGSLALGYFIYGGFLLLLSGGSSDKVGLAKKVITNAVIGIILIFASYIIVNFFITKVLQIPNATFKNNGSWNIFGGN